MSTQSQFCFNENTENELIFYFTFYKLIFSNDTTKISPFSNIIDSPKYVKRKEKYLDTSLSERNNYNLDDSKYYNNMENEDVCKD